MAQKKEKKQFNSIRNESSNITIDSMDIKNIN